MSVVMSPVETEVMIDKGGEGEVVVARDKLTHIVDVDQPRYDDDFAIDWERLGCAVKRKVKAVANLIYNDDRADLAEIIDHYGPADIDLHGRTGGKVENIDCQGGIYCWSPGRAGRGGGNHYGDNNSNSNSNSNNSMMYIDN